MASVQRRRYAKRRKNVDDLLADHEYWIFYNSRNLEHAFDSSLSGRLSDKRKKQFALDTFNLYDDNYYDFIRKLNSMNRSTYNNLYDSWNFLKAGSNSLSSSSNIFIFLLMHFYALKDEYKALVKELIS